MTDPNPRVSLIRAKLQEIHRLALDGPGYAPLSPSSACTLIRHRADEALVELGDLEEDLGELEEREASAWAHEGLPPHDRCRLPADCSCDCLICAEARAQLIVDDLDGYR